MMSELGTTLANWAPAVRAAIFVLFLTGCATHRQSAYVDIAPSVAKSVVFTADGAGNFQACSHALREVIQEDKLPLVVETYEWSHGYLRIVSDQLGYKYAREEGDKLADVITRFHSDHPDIAINLVGHSAGSTVIVSALEKLPPGIVEQAILLSPSLSSEYDIRPALASVNKGLYVFYSKADYIYLGMATDWLGTADRRWTRTAGQVGFHIRLEPDPEGLITKIHQRAWRPEDSLLGNLGGHYGNYQHPFLRARVVPIFAASQKTIDANILPDFQTKATVDLEP